MDDPRRMDDKIMIELKQEFRDFLGRYERDQQAVREWQAGHEKKSDDWRISLEDRIKPWEEFVKSVNMGWKLVIGFAAAVGVVYKGATWLFSHVRFNG